MTKNYLSINKKLKIKTEDGQIYYLGKPNDFAKRVLYADSGALIFNLCRVVGLRKGELLRVVVSGKSYPFWTSLFKIISITIID